MNAELEYCVDRRLSTTKLATLAGDASKIPDEIKESLEMRFTGMQYWDFYDGFTVAARDVYRHLSYPDAEQFRLPRVQYIAASILNRTSHLFRNLELPYPQDLREQLSKLPRSARTAFQNLLMDCPFEPHEYEKLEETVAIGDTDPIGEFLQLDESPLFYAGLFHGYYKLYVFLVELPDASDEDKADFAMSTAVFLAEKLASHRNKNESENEVRESGSSWDHGCKTPCCGRIQ